MKSPIVIPAGAPSGSDSVAVTRNEVARRAIEVFGDSLVLLPPPVLDSSAAEGPSWDMDVRSYETRERVAHYVSQFSGASKEHIAARLEAGTRYEPMIRAKMRAGGLPEDMYYLALIESGFDNNAYSRAAAVGMWQFMTSTARGMGMRVDWWVDERRDPVKSTTAAVRFIRGMRDQFGSLYLAAAAYNGGPGRVARGLARYADDLENTQGEDAFFVLAEKDYLRNETREYVPQLIAAALIAKEPKRYGMTVHTRPAFAYDSVKVPAATPVAAIAKAAGVSVADIRELNPHLLRGMTPPHVTFLVRIPVGSATTFDSNFAALPKADRVATKVVESKKGDTVDRLAEKNGISSASLVTFNPHLRRLKPSGKLVPGQAILIPTHAVAAAALNVPDPGIEKYPGSTAHLRVHTVTRGESVGLIARKYHTTPERIMKLNGLKKAMIFPGQTLVVSGTASKAHRRRQGR
jgi:membrane-bound lytic murein transglycosylase D